MARQGKRPSEEERNNPRHGPEPDFARLRGVLLREAIPERLPLFETFADPEFAAAALGEPQVCIAPGDEGSLHRWLDQYIRFWYRFGYDCVPLLIDMGLRFVTDTAPDTAALSRGERSWRDEHGGLLDSVAAVEAYPWPEPGAIPAAGVSYALAHLPPGMALVPALPAVVEFASALLGTERLYLALADDRRLVEAVTERVGVHVVAAAERLATLDGVGAVCIADDWGHRTGCLIAPRDLRRYVFPWIRRAVERIHAHGRPAILHSCGRIDEVMDDLIDDLGFDAKHSFDDNASPVTEAKRRWGDRIALLGGIDIDALARFPPERLRAYVRELLRVCAAGGGYAAGSGNSLTNYVPVENFRILLEEAAG